MLWMDDIFIKLVSASRSVTISGVAIKFDCRVSRFSATRKQQLLVKDQLWEDHFI